MTLYDSSQLMNIVLSNSYFAQSNPFPPPINYYGFNSFWGSCSGFGLYNETSFIDFSSESTSTRTTSTRRKPRFLSDDSYAKLNASDVLGGNRSGWARYGYDATAGARLANVARNNSVGFTGYCARYVKNAICDAGLGTYTSGHAHNMDEILRRNGNFVEIPASTDVNSLPAGCVLVFNRGSQGYSSSYGHTEITDGRGHGISDGITNNLRQPDAIFMPCVA